MILQSDKMEVIRSFSLHCFQPISLKSSNVNKRNRILEIFLGGSLLSRDMISANR